MKNGVMVMVGGAIGALGRYGLTLLLGSALWPTLIANSLGSFLLSLLMTGTYFRKKWTSAVHTGLTTGVLGGFTTFSTFSFELIKTMQEEKYGVALLYAGLTFFVCLVFTALGAMLSHHLAQRNKEATL
ncbi:CrcB family protein [Bacillaceae bacterium SIJ1]|uniref:fluoride efflux transporter FluC n=1 Tax=Litoribacterium kuwaitense TaxID=1398745 RepID=UPI0013EA4480|nr:CrcB family protein [Litoribacterium kuwaitense]NGP45399.1 CrcB family protein [Litoribacterium kuwaitense]